MTAWLLPRDVRGAARRGGLVSVMAWVASAPSQGWRPALAAGLGLGGAIAAAALLEQAVARWRRGVGPGALVGVTSALACAVGGVLWVVALGQGVAAGREPLAGGALAGLVLGAPLALASATRVARPGGIGVAVVGAALLGVAAGLGVGVPLLTTPGPGPGLLTSLSAAWWSGLAAFASAAAAALLVQLLLEKLDDPEPSAGPAALPAPLPGAAATKDEPPIAVTPQDLRRACRRGALGAAPVVLITLGGGWTAAFRAWVALAGALGAAALVEQALSREPRSVGKGLAAGACWWLAVGLGAALGAAADQDGGRPLGLGVTSLGALLPALLAGLSIGAPLGVAVADRVAASPGRLARGGWVLLGGGALLSSLATGCFVGLFLWPRDQAASPWVWPLGLAVGLQAVLLAWWILGVLDESEEKSTPWPGKGSPG